MNQDLQSAAHLRRILQSLLRINEILLDRFERIVAAAQADEPLSREDRELISTVYKNTLMVGDFETQLIKRGFLDAAGPSEALDLDAARGEVAGRMDRLQDAQHQRSAT